MRGKEEEEEEEGNGKNKNCRRKQKPRDGLFFRLIGFPGWKKVGLRRGLVD